jgi:hypothetical protein
MTFPVTMAMLLYKFGSYVEEVTLALLVNSPVLYTIYLIIIVAIASFGRVPIVHMPVLES